MIAESMLLNPTSHISTWDSLDDPSPAISSYFSTAHVSPLDSPTAALMDFDSSLWEDPDLPAPVDAYSCDQFRMYEFKVRSCARGRSHDWTKCPYAHTGEKARRRDPRKFNYSGAECPDLRHGCCKKGDACEYAHGTFEIWLHPDRYRTQPCRDGTGCRRRVCFFAHTSEQLRIPGKQSVRSPRAREMAIPAVSSPTSILLSPSSDSPPLSPISPVISGGESLSRLVALMHSLRLDELKTNPGVSSFSPNLRRSSGAAFDLWDRGNEEEPAMERVESGRNLRAQMYAKLMRENSVDRVRPMISAGSLN
ncbi:zinc finger CCCH domain-containing protein 20 [Cucumis sativus]|uniref:Putative CCCH-type zinc finger protein CsSEF1 n=1 Tax=Cucumis sativus TaxID=3659 RepID=Q5NDD3_CUCSA|nr:putative CCCH-type zinc finger protein CsSEF1 [Cucumis sativus]